MFISVFLLSIQIFCEWVNEWEWEVGDYLRTRMFKARHFLLQLLYFFSVPLLRLSFFSTTPPHLTTHPPTYNLQSLACVWILNLVADSTSWFLFVAWEERLTCETSFLSHSNEKKWGVWITPTQPHKTVHNRDLIHLEYKTHVPISFKVNPLSMRISICFFPLKLFVSFSFFKPLHACYSLDFPDFLAQILVKKDEYFQCNCDASSPIPIPFLPIRATPPHPVQTLK